MVPVSSTRRSSDAFSTRRDATAGHRPPTLGQGRILAGDCANTEAGHVPPHRPVIAFPKKQLPCNRPRGFGGETLFIYPVRRWQPWKVSWHRGRALNPLLGSRAVPCHASDTRPGWAASCRRPGQSPALSSLARHCHASVSLPCLYPICAQGRALRGAEPSGCQHSPPQTRSLPALVPPCCPVPISVPAVGDTAGSGWAQAGRGGGNKSAPSFR